MCFIRIQKFIHRISNTVEILYFSLIFIVFFVSAKRLRGTKEPKKGHVLASQTHSLRIYN